MQHVDVVGDGQIVGQPGQEQIKTVVIGGETQAEPPYPRLAQQINERRAPFSPGAILRLRAAPSNEFAFSDGKAAVFARIAIKGVEKREVKKADEAGDSEIPAPAKIEQQNSEHRYADS